MRYSYHTDINAPRHGVITLYENADNLKERQDGFISIGPNVGVPGSVVSKSKLRYHKLELVETIIRNELPEKFKARYEHQHIVNTMSCRLIKIDPNTTRFQQEIHNIEFNGLLPKFMAKLFPGMFKKRVQK